MTMNTEKPVLSKGAVWRHLHLPIIGAMISFLFAGIVFDGGLLGSAIGFAAIGLTCIGIAILKYPPHQPIFYRDAAYGVALAE